VQLDELCETLNTLQELVKIFKMQEEHTVQGGKLVPVILIEHTGK
jgi:hypothetical protein